MGFEHVSQPRPEVIQPVSSEFDPAHPFGGAPLTAEQEEHNKRATASYDAERQWKQQDDRDREAQWRYTWADSMLAARGERGRVDDITQVAQAVLPGLLQAHASRNPEAGSLEDDVFGDAQVNGWGSDGLHITFKDNGESEPASLAEGLAFDAYMLAEAFIEVRRRRYGA